MHLKGEIRRAHELALKAHAEQTDKAGEPYFFHVLRVAIEARSHEETNQLVKAQLYVVGLLHDVVEDSEITIRDLSWFSSSIAEAVSAITHLPNEPYIDYLRRVKKNKLATAVKLADLHDNSDFNRFIKLADIDEKAFARVVDVLIPRYIRAHEFLTREDK